MRDYTHSWKDELGNWHEAVPVASIDSRTLTALIFSIESGAQVDYEGEDPAGVLDRFNLELDIRAWGYA